MLTTDLAEALGAVLAGRRSIRSYQDRPIPPEILDRVLTAARHAPSPHHSVPWRFAVLTGAAAKERLANAMGRRWRADLEGDGLPTAEIEEELAKSHRRLTRAPAIVIGCVYYEPLDEYPDPSRQQAELTMAAHSLGAALQNVMLAAHANDLSSCWMCAPVFCPEVVRDALDLSPALIPHALLTIGYPLTSPPVRERPSLDDILVLRA
ncbi:MAG: nitroreductase family protein [Chloroflexi bacterium]|nr:nitroreductase family protein [Chloroflexota bacterium]